jgi:hypothetical protein
MNTNGFMSFKGDGALSVSVQQAQPDGSLLTIATLPAAYEDCAANTATVSWDSQGTMSFIFSAALTT